VLILSMHDESIYAASLRAAPMAHHEQSDGKSSGGVARIMAGEIYAATELPTRCSSITSLALKLEKLLNRRLERSELEVFG